MDAMALEGGGGVDVGSAEGLVTHVSTVSGMKKIKKKKKSSKSHGKKAKSHDQRNMLAQTALI